MADASAEMFRSSEVAARLKISERHLRALVKLHAVPALRLGRTLRFDERAIRHLIEATRCRFESNAAATPELSGSSAPFVPPAKTKGSAYAAVLERTIQGSRRKKLLRSKEKSSAVITLASARGQKPSPKPLEAT